MGRAPLPPEVMGRVDPGALGLQGGSLLLSSWPQGSRESLSFSLHGPRAPGRVPSSLFQLLGPQMSGLCLPLRSCGPFCVAVL